MVERERHGRVRRRARDHRRFEQARRFGADFLLQTGERSGRIGVHREVLAARDQRGSGGGRRRIGRGERNDAVRARGSQIDPLIVGFAHTKPAATRA